MTAPFERLRDQTGGRASTILRALEGSDPVGPHAKARIWARLRTPQRSASRIPFALRVLAFAILLFGSMAIAGGRLRLFGALSSSSSERGAESAGAANAPTALPRLASKGAFPSSPTEPTSALPPALEPTTTESTTPAPSRDSNSVPTLSVAHAPKAPSTLPVGSASASPEPAPAPTARAEAPSPPHSMEEAELVLDGLRALRKEGNPGKARALFTEYLAKHPKGALADDAMGYRMEAADRAGGAGNPEAATFAEVYLNTFPEGRYTALAHRLRSAASPNPK